ncbi:MAG: PAS domain S-box protein [Candidatus Thorarchaeota archaeon]
MKETEKPSYEVDNVYRLMFEDSLDAMFVTTKEGVIVESNKAFVDLSGYTKKELHSINVIELYADASYRKEFIEDIERNGFISGFEFDFKRKDGSIRNCIISATVMYNKKGNIESYKGILRDITEQKIMEESLKESHRRYQSLFENSGSAMIIVDEDTTVSLMNTQFEEISGYKNEEVIGNSFTKYLPPEELERIVKYHQTRRVNPESAPNTVDIKLKRKDGEERDFLYNVSMIPGTMNSLVSLMDITDIKKTEEALRESTESYKKLLSISPDAVLKLDLDFNVLMANKQTLVFFDFEREEEMIGKNVLDYVTGDIKEKILGIQTELLKEGRYNNFEFEITSYKGELKAQEANVTVMYDENNKPEAYLAHVRDVTKRNEMEKQLKEYAHKLEEMVEEKVDQLIAQERAVMLGRLAGSIGHDINNPLQYVLGNAELLKVTIDEKNLEDERIDTLLDTVIEGCYRIGEVSKRLRRVTRKGEMSVFNIYEAIETAVAMTRGRWRSFCTELNFDYKTESPVYVRGIENDISHVLMNLIINSTQALGNHGEITVRTYITEEGNGITIEIEDTGFGIPEDIAEKIGKESVTTKPIEEGTGLGLLLVYDIINLHYGSISFTTEEGKGTNFRITLPLAS